MGKNFKLLLVFALLFGLNLFAQSESESSSSPSFYLQTAVANKYAWRGIIYDQGLVVQPTLGVDYDNWTFQLWGNITAIEEDGFDNNHELDFILQYNFEIGDLTISPILQLYTYPGQEGDSALELYLSCDYVLDDFTFNTTLSREMKIDIPYLFGSHSIAYSKEIGDGLNFDASAGLGWGTKNFNKYYTGVEKGAMNYVFANASVSYALNDKITLAPFLESYFLTDTEIKDATNDSLVNFGLNLSITF